ncbi:lipoprotein-anchoring transpeptidase ErfK/SrfK [Kibdelosporangium banguiense]|uniref:Lipoprotein-anchoring transpeptidase ErfK/SrfK n=1 Tax=Kibdelosporangium banguiense TaxID=1365924 RepID=A0ABS4TNC1_9PSEU|nr:Ig-like domain-containing protein [Kibdelosporangium banguiense]MBP2325909.1 lipoprotein-anchoring transpeptidase ErfK/SrfK [Kibdelosporangium banguiense]
MALLLASVLAITGCSGENEGAAPAGKADSKSNGSTASAPAAKIVADPAVDAKDVPVLQPVKISVSDGKLTEVVVNDPEGKPVAGDTTADKLSWANSQRLDYGKTYTYAAKAMGADNKPAELKGSFSTVKPAKTIRATVNPADGQTVGVGMPISVNFPDDAPKDRAAAEKALKIETTPQVEGSWAWVSANKADWRPKEYWPAGTKVKVSASLYGVNYGNGYGRADVTSEFSIGRKQVLKVNTPDHSLKVYRNGALTATYPSSNGKDSNPDLNTPNGTLIVMSKEPVGDFSNPAYGYTNVKKKWAMRISNHGEYLHENEENAANIGKANTSHGCVNLFEKDAKALFDTTLIGDPVEVTGSKVAMPTTSEVNDWLFSWEKWTGMSALK